MWGSPSPARSCGTASATRPSPTGSMPSGRAARPASPPRPSAPSATRWSRTGPRLCSSAPGGPGPASRTRHARSQRAGFVVGTAYGGRGFELIFEPVTSFPCWSYICSNTGMVQVMPVARMRWAASGPAAPAGRRASRRGSAMPPVGRIMRRDWPHRQPASSAGCPANQGRGRGGSSAGPPGTRDGRTGQPWHVADGSATTKAGPPGTGHTPGVRE